MDNDLITIERTRTVTHQNKVAFDDSGRVVDVTDGTLDDEGHVDPHFRVTVGEPYNLTLSFECSEEALVELLAMRLAEQRQWGGLEDAPTPCREYIESRPDLSWDEVTDSSNW